MRSQEKFYLPNSVLSIVERLEGAGHETWCVGGAVRDFVLGLPNADHDLATAANPDAVQSLFRRTVPVGADHGTVAVLDDENRAYEVTTFRKDVKTDGRHAKVEFGVSIDDDLARRDFTINAIAYRPTRDEWKDPYEGIADVEAGIVKAVGDPSARFQEDFLRILRAIRFATRFGFEIEERTWDAALANVAGLASLSAERVRDEWFKSLRTAQKGSEAVELWQNVGAIKMWLTEIGDLEGKKLNALDLLVDRDPVLMTCFLANDPAALLDRLKCSRGEIRRGELIGRFREPPPRTLSFVDVRQWLAKAGSASDDLVRIWYAESGNESLQLVVEEIRSAGYPLSVSSLAVNGSDLRAFGVPQGPELGRMLERMLADVLDEPHHNNKEYLMAFAKMAIKEDWVRDDR